MITLQHVGKQFTVQQQQKGAKHFVRNLLRPQVRTITAVSDLSFAIQPGEMVGFIGENGAGKSTTIKMMCGILFPTSGEIWVNGRIPYRQRKENATHIGVVFGQRSRLVWDLPMTDTFGLYKEIYRIDDARYARNVRLFTELLSMGDYVKTPIRQLSLGQRMADAPQAPDLAGLPIEVLVCDAAQCRFAYNPATYTLIEVLALLARLGEVVNVDVKPQDIVRGIYADT